MRACSPRWWARTGGFALGDVLALKFPDGAFDACRYERVLMHVDGDPARGIDRPVHPDELQPEQRTLLGWSQVDQPAADHRLHRAQCPQLHPDAHAVAARYAV